MIEWWYEAGIGENRAALVEGDRIIEAAIELPGRLAVGTIAPARLVELGPARQGRVTLDTGEEATLDPVPPAVTQGARLTVRVVREAIPEPGRPKLPKAVATDDAPAPGPSLLDRIAATDLPVRTLLPHQPDALEAAGWSELLDEAETGEIAFPGGSLRMSPTPAMTLFDIDGGPPLDRLALAGAQAAAAAIRRHGIGGSIGIDFPTLSGKAERQAVAAAVDAALPQPFERTAVNGFGFLQIVRPRPRASLPELLRADPIGAAARASLRRLEREPPGPPRPVKLPPAVLARIEAEGWDVELMRRTGRMPIWDRS
ncbi:ribonuclease [Sphingomonas lenta]|uniref:Ribonuclease n=1 Tax=Sphingomonas lenta TaxID=1141887 RepID=A0A2A2SEZ8_9SPHN|nr:ribonuclease [Sphingomonas lenta]PAX07827.1 ribonuclease [Sphingomonas lenta]